MTRQTAQPWENQTSSPSQRFPKPTGIRSHAKRGRNGVRDLQALLSALAIPQATSDGNYPHADLFEMRAACAFYLCRNYPFVDGNKRTVLASALVFLEMNGVSLNDPCGFLYDAMVKIAAGMLDKHSLVELLHRLSQAPGQQQHDPLLVPDTP